MAERLPLAGRQVHRCFVGDWVFWLEFLDPPSDVFVCIENSFRLLRSGIVTELNEGDLAGLGKAVILAGREVTSSMARDDGTLELTFDDGTVLEVPPHYSYESWRIEGPKDFYAVCLPGGQVATCGAADEKES